MRRNRPFEPTLDIEAAPIAAARFIRPYGSSQGFPGRQLRKRTQWLFRTPALAAI
jgi:hypothetical protein